MTVKQLLQQLEDMPQNAEVQLEGCDCYQGAGGVELYKFDGIPTVLIRNSLNTKLDQK